MNYTPYPNYLNNGGNIYSPYAPSMPYNAPQYPNNQANQQIPGLSGRYVMDFGEVNASDVPMNGKQAVFIKSDLSEIQTRAWDNNGSITTKRYLPFVEQLAPNTDKLTGEEEKAQIGQITAQLDRIEKLLTRKKNNEGNEDKNKE